MRCTKAAPTKRQNQRVEVTPRSRSTCCGSLRSAPRSPLESGRQSQSGARAASAAGRTGASSPTACCWLSPTLRPATCCRCLCARARTAAVRRLAFAYLPQCVWCEKTPGASVRACPRRRRSITHTERRQSSPGGRDTTQSRSLGRAGGPSSRPTCRQHLAKPSRNRSLRGRGHGGSSARRGSGVPGIRRALVQARRRPWMATAPRPSGQRTPRQRTREAESNFA